MVSIQPLSKNNVPNLNSIKPEKWPDIEKIHGFYLANDYCHPIKAMIGDELVGIGTSICFGNTAWLAHIIVAQDHRNQGIGGLIVQSLLTDLQNRYACESVSLIATDMGFPVYLKYGFNTQTQYYAFQSETEHPLPVAPDNIQGISADHIPAILALDRQITGEDRRVLIHPALASGFVYCQNHHVQGYYLPDLGEGPVYAPDPQAGLALLQMKITKSNKVVIPADNTVACDFLLKNGFVKIEEIRRMVHGSEFPWQPQHFFSRVGGWVG